MRLKRNRIKTFYLKKREVFKDNEGGTYEEYGKPLEIRGEAWPASGKAQAEQYGERLNYIYNMWIDGNYHRKTDEKGRVYYEFVNGMTIQELDGICLHVDSDADPDYKIISIKPYRHLKLEVEKIIC